MVLCIDRDGDIEKKIGEKGPIIGRDKVLKTATKLGLSDPSESDTNVLFAGIKILDILKTRYPEVEVIALTGSQNVGFESDLIIGKQLDTALKYFPADGVILVSDGAEDEHVLPIVQAKTKVISVERVVVKQSEALESFYYVILDFLKEVTSDQKLARLVFGLPGIALILYMVLGIHAGRVIFGVLGILLVIKGFNLEEPLENNIIALRQSLVTDKASFFTYIIAALVAFVGLLRGYEAIVDTYFETTIDAIPIAIGPSKDLLASAGILALVGRSIDAIIERRGLGKYLILGTFLMSLWFIIGNISSFILKEISLVTLVVTVSIGAGISLTAFLLGKAASGE